MFSQGSQEACAIGGNMICTITSMKTSCNSLKTSVLQHFNNTKLYSFSLGSELPSHLIVIFHFNCITLGKELHKTLKIHNKQ